MTRFGRAAAVVVVAAIAAGWLALSGYGSTAMLAVRAAAWRLDIDAAMDVIGIRAGMVVGEAGAGDGYFTLPMARRVGPSGVVYANDISARALRTLAANARREGLTNIHTVEGSVNDPQFPRRDLDMVVIVHAFHDFSEPVAWLQNAKKYLKPGSPVAIVDSDPERGAGSHFLSRGRVLDYAAKAGFEPVKVVDDVSEHLIIVVRPARTDSALTAPSRSVF